jgi:hypothetical protein
MMVWGASTAAVMIWIWLSAARKARKMYMFDRSVGAVTVYAWHVLVTLFWTLLLALTSFGLFSVQSLDF